MANNRKLKIIFPTEFTALDTGYSTLSRELYKELYATDKYDLAEISCYCRTDLPQHIEMMKNIPWKVYPVITPNQNGWNEQEYVGTPTAEFGSLVFDRACLDFQPDICMGIRDAWMDAYIDQSPFRRLFKTVFMPTVDATFQQAEWLDLYQRTDYVLSYTEFGEKTLREESGNTINLCGTASPAVDIHTFKFIQNKAEQKEKMGLPPDSIIIGMVARNQRRKLFPALMESFVDFLHKLDLNNTENVYLYLHTSYPDLGWSIPTLVAEHGLSHKVLFTFKCRNCRFSFPQFYRDVRLICPRCKQCSVTFANSQDGITREELANTYSVMDLYCQYASNEGFGISAIEAACCGVPVCGTNYSGVESVLKNVDGYPIPYQLYVEVETGRKLAIPNNEALAEYIRYFTGLPGSMRLRLGYNTHAKAVKRYGSWKDVAAKWMSIFDQISPPQVSQWLSPIDYIAVEGLPPCPAPDRVTDEQFVTWALTEILHRPDWANSYMGLKLCRDLIYGNTSRGCIGWNSNELSALGGRASWSPVTRDDTYNSIKGLRNKWNSWEIERHNRIKQGLIS